MMGKPSKASDKRSDEAFAWMEEMWPQVDARLAEFAAEVRRAVKDARARRRLMALFEQLARSLCIEREEAARLWYESGSYSAFRRAGDQNIAAQNSGQSKAAKRAKAARVKRDKDIEKVIRERHSDGIWGKRLVGELINRWGIEADDPKKREVEKGYALSTAVLRKRESSIRNKNKKAPGRE